MIKLTTLDIAKERWSYIEFAKLARLAYFNTFESVPFAEGVVITDWDGIKKQYLANLELMDKTLLREIALMEYIEAKHL